MAETGNEGEVVMGDAVTERLASSHYELSSVGRWDGHLDLSEIAPVYLRPAVFILSLDFSTYFTFIWSAFQSCQNVRRLVLPRVEN